MVRAHSFRGYHVKPVGVTHVNAIGKLCFREEAEINVPHNVQGPECKFQPSISTALDVVHGDANRGD